jgi:hypothetical protein
MVTNNPNSDIIKLEEENNIKTELIKSIKTKSNK